MKKIIDKTVDLELVGVNGNAFAVIGTFQKQAQKEGWNQDEIDAVLKEATRHNYDHLLTTILNHCDPKDDTHHEF